MSENVQFSRYMQNTTTHVALSGSCCLSSGSLNSHYRQVQILRTCRGIKTDKFSIGTHVRKRTVFPLHAKYHNTRWSLWLLLLVVWVTKFPLPVGTDFEDLQWGPRLISLAQELMSVSPHQVHNTLVTSAENAGDLNCVVVFCAQREYGTFLGMSFYAKHNRLGPHYISSKSVMGIQLHRVYLYYFMSCL